MAAEHESIAYRAPATIGEPFQRRWIPFQRSA